MTDIFEAKEKELSDYLNAFPRVPDQKGLLVFINGTVVGFDIISRTAAYELLHPKLVQSYVMGALLRKANGRRKAALEDARACYITRSLREQLLPSSPGSTTGTSSGLSCEEAAWHGQSYEQIAAGLNAGRKIDQERNNTVQKRSTYAYYLHRDE